MYFAITGGIACGKSALAGCLAVLGVDILDADDVVHRLQASGGPAIEPIREQFGNEAIDQSGAVDRKWLGERVFRLMVFRSYLAFLSGLKTSVSPGARVTAGKVQRTVPR